MVATSFVVSVCFVVVSSTEPVAALPISASIHHIVTLQDHPPQQKQKPKPVKVTGKVKDDGGSPVAKARVKITGPDEFEHETWTDEGVFEFTAPDETGPYQITVKVGDKEGTFEAEIRKKRLSPSEFTLRSNEFTP